MTAIFFTSFTAGEGTNQPGPLCRTYVESCMRKTIKTFYMFIVIKGLFTGPKEHYMLTCVCGCVRVLTT